VFEDAAAIGIRPADRYPKATEHIAGDDRAHQRLIDSGHAYVVDRQRVLRRHVVPGLRQALGNTLDKLRRGTATCETDRSKRHEADFALWKAAGPGG
jgi:cysteinyl-tRNA synthetase